MLNIEKYEKELKKYGTSFALTKEEKPVDCDGFRCIYCAFGNGCIIKRMNWLLQEYKEPILNDKEKVIIKDIIKAFEPFGKKLKYITKDGWNCDESCYLNFKYENDSFGTLTFNSGKLFKGMEIDKAYTLDELELYKEVEN